MTETVPAADDAPPDLASLPRDDLLSMREAAVEVLTCQHVLAKTGHTVLTELGAGPAATIADWQHYPQGDVYDAEHHAQFYFHIHPEAERLAGELGHFHLFLRRESMPIDIVPLAEQGDGLCHLAAVSVDGGGRPLHLFTTNRWVTNETWFAASDLVGLVDRFAIGHAQPSWPVNRWVTALSRLYRPEIGWLLRRRDRALADHGQGRPLHEVLEDRSVEILSGLDIDIAERIDDLDAALRRQRRAGLSSAPVP